MIRKESSDGVGYSVVEVNGVSHIFAAAVPRTGETLAEQAHDALRTIEAAIDEEGARGSIVNQAVFVPDASQTETCRRIIHEFYGDQMPATTYIFQPPCCDKLLSIEALGVGRGRDQVEIRRVSERRAITTAPWRVLDSLRSDHARNDGDQRLRADAQGFSADVAGAAPAGVRFQPGSDPHLALPGRHCWSRRPGAARSRIELVRTDFFRGVKFGTELHAGGFRADPCSPASTGIGADNRDVVMSCIAPSTRTPRPCGPLMPLENPLQMSAYDYSAVLQPEKPQVRSGPGPDARDRCSTIFVSGTASITDSETRSAGRRRRC